MPMKSYITRQSYCNVSDVQLTIKQDMPHAWGWTKSGLLHFIKVEEALIPFSNLSQWNFMSALDICFWGDEHSLHSFLVLLPQSLSFSPCLLSLTLFLSFFSCSISFGLRSWLSVACPTWTQDWVCLGLLSLKTMMSSNHNAFPSS